MLSDVVNAAVIVAHPDDETLWAGGLILQNPQIEWEIITLCRKSDADRNPKFYKALKALNASGEMADIDDGPEQEPIEILPIENQIISLLEKGRYDLIVTHNSKGEYTRHRRHEEVSEAVVDLIVECRLKADKLIMFAYEDGGKEYYPRPMGNADVKIKLAKDVWQKKYEIVNNIYGFDSKSWEAKTTPKVEAFWYFDELNKIDEKIAERGKK